jgi:hypothetical protein
METFNFPFHKQQTNYPDNSFRVAFGRGYQFAAKAPHPGQRIFVLSFVGMRYVVTGGVLDKVTDPTKNMGKLQDFYEAHMLYEPFIYPHPVLGNVTVRFNRPLQIPKGMSGGFGVVEDFELEFIEQP